MPLEAVVALFDVGSDVRACQGGPILGAVEQIAKEQRWYGDLFEATRSPIDIQGSRSPAGKSLLALS